MTTPVYVPASHSLTPALKRRTLREARKQQANPSVIVRQALTFYFQHLDAIEAMAPAPVPAAPAAPAPSIAEVPAGSPVDGESLPQIAS